MVNISIIVAMAKNKVIGNKGKLPWHIPEDLKWFKKVTMGKPIIMGRKTFLSIGKPLPGRKNIILSKNPNFLADGCLVFNGLESAIEQLASESEVMVIGGAQLYACALPLTQKIYLTLIDQVVAGDTYFPDYDLADWQLIEEKCLSGIEKYQFTCKHMIYSRK